MVTCVRLDAIPARTEGGFHVVVETPRGAAFKLKLDATLGVLTLKRPLPLGFTWPYDFGFVPSTKAPDGDPVDALVWWDAATPAGVVIPCRALGVLQLDQRDGGRRVRNDRIVAVPLRFERGDPFRTIEDLPPRVREELAHFSTSAVYFEGKDVHVLGWGGPAAADAIVDGASAGGGGGAGAGAGGG
jgi:inorganic pyrophosphatase